MNTQTTFKFTEYAATTALRSILGVIFVWLGLLKITGHAPGVLGLDALPYFAIDGTEMWFGLLEAGVGVLLLLNVAWSFTELLLAIYMVGAALVLVSVPEMVFAPSFPHITTLGELVLKNIVVGIAGVGVLIHEQRQRYLSEHTENPLTE